MRVKAVFFMKKLLKWTAFVLVLLGTFSLLRDRQILNRGLVRLHVVGASDSEADQALKLRVRDAVLECVASLGDPQTIEEAKALLEANLPAITEAANKALDGLGTAAVTLCREAFPIREYDSFTLPSGVYESLRVKIGEAQGRNWWCVVFPTLCLPAAGEDLDSVAAGAGFSESLTEAIKAPETEVSFFFLDLLGKAESFLFSMFH
jgi:stage II sporulation protein R